MKVFTHALCMCFYRIDPDTFQHHSAQALSNVDELSEGALQLWAEQEGSRVRARVYCSLSRRAGS